MFRATANGITASSPSELLHIKLPCVIVFDVLGEHSEVYCDDPEALLAWAAEVEDRLSDGVILDPAEQQAVVAMLESLDAIEMGLEAPWEHEVVVCLRQKLEVVRPFYQTDGAEWHLIRKAAVAFRKVEEAAARLRGRVEGRVIREEEFAHV